MTMASLKGDSFFSPYVACFRFLNIATLLCAPEKLVDSGEKITKT